MSAGRIQKYSFFKIHINTIFPPTHISSKFFFVSGIPANFFGAYFLLDMRAKS